MRWLLLALLTGCFGAAGQTERHCTSRAAGAGEACLKAGRAAVEGIGRTKNVQRGRELWEVGCRLGQGEACLALAVGLREGIFGEPDIVEAKHVLQIGCDGTSAICCVELAELSSALGNDEKMVRALNRACNKGDKEACLDLAHAHHAVENETQAAKAWVRACRLGDDHACNVVDGQSPGLPKPGQTPEEALEASTVGGASPAGEDDVASDEDTDSDAPDEDTEAPGAPTGDADDADD